MKKFLFLLFVFLILFTFTKSVFAESQTVYDVVISNGRVMDPETKLDKEGLNVGIKGKTISKITSEKIKGKTEINAAGKIIAPGFIDLMSYNPNSYGVWYKIADGVTTNLAMHGGTVYPESWYKTYIAAKPPLNFGTGFFYNSARNQLGINMYKPATVFQMKTLAQMARNALKTGALGIGMSPEYVPGTSTEEIDAMMKVAKEFDVPVFFHVRYSDMEPPGTNIEALNEVIGSARRTGAAIHIDHINSTGGTFSMPESLKILSDARKEGLNITADLYPYDFWGTYLNSARFNAGWQERFRITYKDLQIAGTEERLTPKSFAKYRKLGKLAIAYAIPEGDVVEALRDPFVMIGSDAILEPSNNNHPRGAGAFSRTIAKYVRQKNTISLMEAIEKMTIMPAKRLEKKSPALRKKGRLQENMDADIVIFDFDKIQDNATVVKPNQYSSGIDYVLINGKIVKTPTGLNKNTRVGEAIRGVAD